jgi:hypothetical protein
MYRSCVMYCSQVEPEVTLGPGDYRYVAVQGRGCAVVCGLTCPRHYIGCQGHGCDDPPQGATGLQSSADRILTVLLLSGSVQHRGDRLLVRARLQHCLPLPQRV